MDKEKHVFVTVGTTLFDGLVSAVMKRDVLEILHSKGFTSMEIQYGNGTFIPNEGIRHGVVITSFQFKDSILENLTSADLVISHGGAGSCLETLALGKPLIAVINDTLMNNHQVELAEALSEEHYCNWCYRKDLPSTVDKFSLKKLKPFTKGDSSKLINYINSSFKNKND